MKCPTCKRRAGVVETREVPNTDMRRRRYSCQCGHRFTTYELLDTDGAIKEATMHQVFKTAA